MLNRQYSISAAVGLFKSGVSLILVGLAYFLAYKTSDYRIF
jgi:putative aldouronate transport system permease protein